MNYPASFVAVAALAAVHLFAGRLRFIDVIPRSRFLSFAGGMSVAYVFLRILPALGETQEQVGDAVERTLAIPQDGIYFVALVGLVVFYWLERLAERSREQQSADGEPAPSHTVFWVSILSYSAVNFSVGYLLLQHETTGLRRLSLFFLAMALWFVINDYGIRVQHRRHYRLAGRWILAGAVVVGWAVALYAPVPENLLSLLLAFVAGGIVLNVMKEELPRERESRFWAFALGAGAYSTLLLTL